MKYPLNNRLAPFQKNLFMTLLQGFEMDDGNRGKFISPYLVIFRDKKNEKFVLCKSFSQLEVIYVNIRFS